MGGAGVPQDPPPSPALPGVAKLSLSVDVTAAIGSRVRGNHRSVNASLEQRRNQIDMFELSPERFSAGFICLGMVCKEPRGQQGCHQPSPSSSSLSPLSILSRLSLCSVSLLLCTLFISRTLVLPET